jgi:hypothetical protein
MALGKVKSSYKQQIQSIHKFQIVFGVIVFVPLFLITFFNNTNIDVTATDYSSYIQILLKGSLSTIIPWIFITFLILILPELVVVYNFKTNSKNLIRNVLISLLLILFPLVVENYHKQYFSLLTNKIPIPSESSYIYKYGQHTSFSPIDKHYIFINISDKSDFDTKINGLATIIDFYDSHSKNVLGDCNEKLKNKTSNLKKYYDALSESKKKINLNATDNFNNNIISSQLYELNLQSSFSCIYETSGFFPQKFYLDLSLNPAIITYFY